MSPGTDPFPEVFQRLRAIIKPYAPRMRVIESSASTHSLDTRHVMPNGKPLFFSSVTVRKNYVSFHLMPLYVFPDLLDSAGELRTRMQGKSCFNFRHLDDAQIQALDALVRRGFERYAAEGLLDEA
jgi:hypothetical protein